MSQSAVRNGALLAQSPGVRWQRTLTAALLLVALLRLGLVVVHQPLAAYANQYDMVRTAACIGLWPAGDPAQRALATPDAPRPEQVLDAPQPEGCYPSTEVALAWVGVAVARGLDALGVDGQPDLDLRAIGASKALLITLFMLAINHALRAHPTVACAHAAMVAVVIVDPLNTLYLSTLYTETGALLGAWLAAVGLVLRAGSRTDHRLAFAAVVFGTVLLGASRVQHLALPFGFALLWWLTVRAAGATGAHQRLPTPRAAVAAPSVSRSPLSSGMASSRWAAARGPLAQCLLLILIASLTVVLQASTQQRFESIANANRQNLLFGALLPAADDPARLASRIGLPAHCAQLAYASWYRPLGRDLAASCPEAKRPSLARIAAVLASEPSTALTLLGRGLLQSSAWRPRYVGEIAGASYARLGPGPFALTASFADVAATAPLWAHALFWLMPLLAGFGATWRLLRAASHRGTEITLDVSRAACAGMIATVWATAILGDGYSEMARHLHLAVNAAAVGWLLLVCAVLSKRWAAMPEWSAMLAVALVICLVGQNAPLAVGRMDQPEQDQRLDGVVAISGWVLTPRGAAAIELREAGRVVHRFDVKPAADVARIFPIAQRAYAFRFEGVYAAGVARDRTLELYLAAADGSVQRFDRRRFDLQP